MRSYAARHADGARSFLLMARGWIRADLGGPNAPFTMEEAVPDIVKVVIAQQGRPGLQYLDRKGRWFRGEVTPTANILQPHGSPLPHFNKG